MEEVLIILKSDFAYEYNDQMNDQMNRIINLSFGHSLESDSLSHTRADYICIIKVDGIIVGLAMIDNKIKNVMQPLSKEYLFIHTVAVHPEYRSRGYCDLMIKEIVKQYGAVKSMYLSVETGLHTANKGAIKCYQKNGFRLVDCLYEERQTDDILSYMVRLSKPVKLKKIKKIKKIKKTKRKRRTTNKINNKLSIKETQVKKEIKGNRTEIAVPEKQWYQLF